MEALNPGPLDYNPSTLKHLAMLPPVGESLCFKPDNKQLEDKIKKMAPHLLKTF